MSEEAAAIPAGGETVTILSHTPGGDGPLSPRDAARSLTDARNKALAQANKPEQQEESAAPATPAQESEAAPAADDAAPEEVRSETQEADPEEKLPPIEPPRSWTKEDKELFTGLPRETQERLVERERSRETDFLRRQNEAAEKLKGLTAKEQAAEQVKQQYEAALPQLLQTLQALNAGEFPDIKSIEDSVRLSAEDPVRYVKWRAFQDQIAAISYENDRVKQQQDQARQDKRSKFISEQDKLFLEKAPELSDKKKAQEVADGAVSVLRELGFKDEELGKSWMGEETLSLRDHRLQLLIRDAVSYRESQKKQAEALKKAATKELPPVQRPGAGKPANSGAHAQIQTLEKQLANASGLSAIRIGAKLQAARRSAQ